MDITYASKDNIKIITKNVVIQVNPDKETKADAILYHHRQISKSGVVSFSSPGEYEVKGVMIDGISLGEDNTAFCVSSEDLKVAYIAGKVSELTDLQVESFGGIDALVIALDDQPGDIVIKLINQIEPRIVVPIDYSPSALTSFLKEIGGEPEKLERLKLTKRDLPEDNQKIVLISK